jgi:hypothetical protein
MEPLLPASELPVLMLTEPDELATDDPVLNTSDPLPASVASLLLCTSIPLPAPLRTDTAPPSKRSADVLTVLAPTATATSPDAPVRALPLRTLTLPLLSDSALANATLPLVPSVLAPL